MNAIKCLEHIPEQPVSLEYSPLSDSILTQKQNEHLLLFVFFRTDSTVYSTANYIRIESEERYRAIKFLAIIAITAMMAIPIIQHIQQV